MTDLIESAPTHVPAVLEETHSIDGDLNRMASDLAKVAQSLGPIKAGDVGNIKTKTGPGFRYAYAGLPTIMEALIPVLSAHEIALVQVPLASPKGAGAVTHVLGQGWRMSCTLLFPMGQASPQAIGSAQTYARRYSLLGLFALAPDEDAGDGNGAEQAHQKQRGQRAAQRDQENGRGAQIAPPKAHLDAFAQFGISERVLVAQLQGTPLGKMSAQQQRDLRVLHGRLNSGEPPENVLGADAVAELRHEATLGERKRTIEAKAAVHEDAREPSPVELFESEREEGTGYEQ